MKINRLIKLTIVTGLFLTAAGMASAGSLDPPGPPGPTMKTLDQIEPRTPITAVPFTVSQPGSYYLIANLPGAGHGVIIATNNVTLDLMGFSIEGSGGATTHGVFINGATNSPIRNVVVRNGVIRNFGIGIRANYSQDSRFERLNVVGNSSVGVRLDGRNGGQCNGNTIAHCTISGNGSHGIYLYGVEGRCDGNTIADCTITGNGGDGVRLDAWDGQSNGNRIADCTISGNGWYGIYLYGFDGQCAGNTIVNCTARDNRDRGISLSYADGNRVENNHISGTIGAPSYGIITSVSSANFILRNTCVGQTNNFQITANDTYGPIVTDSGALGTTGAAAHPWANFSR